MSYVQTNIKSKTGIGKPMFVKFFAAIDYDKPSNPVTYDLSPYGEDDCMKTDPDRYCLRACYRICEFLSRVFHYDIIKMKPTFIKDDDGKIWIFEIKDIVVRAQPEKMTQN